MSVCIYCGIAEATSSEHILQDSLGANFEKKNILCQECNNLFGRTVDRVLADEFIFFKNYLSIKGKRGKIPKYEMKDVEGKIITRDGKTGAITTENPVKYNSMVTNSDGTQSITMTAEVSKTEGILKSIKKNLAKQGLSVASLTVNEYHAESSGELKAQIDISLLTYVALKKSLINFWCFLRKDQDLLQIRAEAKKIYDFAKFCESNACSADRIQFAKQLNIETIPLIVQISERAKKAMQGKAFLFNSIFLVDFAGTLHGGICLFNSVLWGFKLSTAPAITQPEFITFNIVDRKIYRSRGQEEFLEASDFNFVFENSFDSFKNIFINHISCAVKSCLYMEHRLSTKQAIKGDDFYLAYPITDKNVIKHILKERTAILLGWKFRKFRIHPSFFKSIEADYLIENIFSSCFGEAKSNLTADSYKKYICASLIMMSKLRKKNFFMRHIMRKYDNYLRTMEGKCQSNHVISL